MFVFILATLQGGSEVHKTHKEITSDIDGSLTRISTEPICFLALIVI